MWREGCWLRRREVVEERGGELSCTLSSRRAAPRGRVEGAIGRRAPTHGQRSEAMAGGRRCGRRRRASRDHEPSGRVFGAGGAGRPSDARGAKRLEASHAWSFGSVKAAVGRDGSRFGRASTRGELGEGKKEATVPPPALRAYKHLPPPASLSSLLSRVGERPNPGRRAATAPVGQTSPRPPCWLAGPASCGLKLRVPRPGQAVRASSPCDRAKARVAANPSSAVGRLASQSSHSQRRMLQPETRSAVDDRRELEARQPSRQPPQEASAVGRGRIVQQADSVSRSSNGGPPSSSLGPLGGCCNAVSPIRASLDHRAPAAWPTVGGTAVGVTPVRSAVCPSANRTKEPRLMS